jgi:hypothetical protein
MLESVYRFGRIRGQSLMVWCSKVLDKLGNKRVRSRRVLRKVRDKAEICALRLGHLSLDASLPRNKTTVYVQLEYS